MRIISKIEKVFVSDKLFIGGGRIVRSEKFVSKKFVG